MKRARSFAPNPFANNVDQDRIVSVYEALPHLLFADLNDQAKPACTCGALGPNLSPKTPDERVEARTFGLDLLAVPLPGVYETPLSRNQKGA